MTLIEKLRAAQGDNAELCHAMADLLISMLDSDSMCAVCVNMRMDSVGRGECCIDGCEWDWEGNNDSLQPHTEAPKKRELVLESFQEHTLLTNYVKHNHIKKKNILCIATSPLGSYTMFYWKDVKTE